MLRDWDSNSACDRHCDPRSYLRRVANRCKLKMQHPHLITVKSAGSSSKTIVSTLSISPISSDPPTTSLTKISTNYLPFSQTSLQLYLLFRNKSRLKNFGSKYYYHLKTLLKQMLVLTQRKSLCYLTLWVHQISVSWRISLIDESRFRNFLIFNTWYCFHLFPPINLSKRNQLIV